jgi:hypothetical protein
MSNDKRRNSEIFGLPFGVAKAIVPFFQWQIAEVFPMKIILATFRKLACYLGFVSTKTQKASAATRNHAHKRQPSFFIDVALFAF